MQRYGKENSLLFFKIEKDQVRAGWGGLLQPLADGVKMFMKEEIIPNVSNRALFILGPSLFMITAVVTSAVVPWAKPVNIGGHVYDCKLQTSILVYLFIRCCINWCVWYYDWWLGI
jgi:NADH-quinone oxidoreductase subunit H